MPNLGVQVVVENLVEFLFERNRFGYFSHQWILKQFRDNVPNKENAEQDSYDTFDKAATSALTSFNKQEQFFNGYAYDFSKQVQDEEDNN